ncbi:DUF6517 family protein [Natrialba sp. PRR66]|uniref:DUF6517 family protein n=1 Tax=Natrialba sp. PRR66 TaxID=3098146 RepID=UPI002B1DD329|nr:DUF6517 family protein [Natrialba sp. PRR66]
MERRAFVAATAVSGLGLSAGCLGGMLEDVTSVSATPAIVSSTALETADYEYQGTREVTETETVAGQPIEATNYASEYTRTIDALAGLFGDETPAVGVFGVATTPQIGFLDTQLNPISDMSNAELVNRVQNQYDEFTIDDRVVERRTAEPFGQPVTVETFPGTATHVSIGEIEIFVDVAQLTSEGDHLVLIGVTPDIQRLQRENEVDRIDTLIDGVEHGDGLDREAGDVELVEE